MAGPDVGSAVVDQSPSGLHVTERPGDGEAPAVVIVHGGMDRQSSFGRVARGLPEVPLVLYDRRGYARSGGAGVGDLDRQVDDLLTVIAGRPVAVFGHSLGAVIALAAAARDAESIRGLLLYEPPTPWASWWPRPSVARPEDPADHAEQFMRSMVGERIWARLPAATRAQRRAEGPALRADLAAVEVADAPHDASQVPVPALVVAGAETTWWHRRAAEETAALLPAGRFEVLAEANHAAHLGRPAAVAELVRRVRAMAAEPMVRDR